MNIYDGIEIETLMIAYPKRPSALSYIIDIEYVGSKMYILYDSSGLLMQLSPTNYSWR